MVLDGNGSGAPSKTTGAMGTSRLPHAVPAAVERWSTRSQNL